MGESIITMSLAGLLAGFILSMPVAGPISILVTSNALKGRLRYCNLVNAGAAIADFIYVFVAVFGLTKLYAYYKPVIPYIFGLGALLLFYLGYRIFRTKIDIEHLDDKNHVPELLKKKEKGAFYTGFMINFFNPTLFIGWLTSSLIVISILAGMGFHTGGLADQIDQNAKEISMIEGKNIKMDSGHQLEKLENIQLPKLKNHEQEPVKFPPNFHLIISICYALCISIGSISWFYLLAHLIVRYRKKINIRIISLVVKGMGIVLCLFGIFFGYQAILLFSSGLMK
jgi:threonine/homoserine/homoserine lactone efflux protein